MSFLSKKVSILDVGQKRQLGDDIVKKCLRTGVRRHLLLMNKSIVLILLTGLLQLLVTINGTLAELLLDTDELVVLSHTVGTRQ